LDVPEENGKEGPGGGGVSADLTLYSVVDTLPALIDSLDMTEPGSPERAECEAEITRYFEALPQKVDGVAHVHAHLEAQVKFAGTEIQRLQNRKRRFEHAVERMEAYIMSVLDRLPVPKRGPKKLEGATATFSLCKCPASLRITDEAKIPAEYRIVIPAVPATTQVDPKAVKQALQLGIVVPGAELITDKHRLGVS
jgi:hypothetical protein